MLILCIYNNYDTIRVFRTYFSVVTVVILLGGKQMLTQKDFGILKGIKIYSYACDSPKKYFHIPDPYQLYKEMVARINNKGFSSVKRASPKDANLIIRKLSGN